MTLLLDSHILLWALADDERLSDAARSLLLDEANTIYFSVASVWELSIKHLLHPEAIPFSSRELTSLCRAAGFEALDIQCHHVTAMESLHRAENAPRHKDPFDRIILAQAKAEKMTLLTHDRMFTDYLESCVMIV